MAERRIGGKGGGSDPGPKPAKKATTVAAAATVAVIGVGGTTTGAFSVSGGTASSGEATLSRMVKARKADGKNAAKRGSRPAEVWRKMGMRQLDDVVRNGGDCAINSFDEIRVFLLRTPCKSMDRALFYVDDGHGGSILISLVWVEFRGRGDARKFRSLIDEHGNGDMKPMAAGLLKLADVRFSGLNYGSEIHGGRTVTVAETEQVQGAASAEVLDTIADVAAHLPKPGKR